MMCHRPLRQMGYTVENITNEQIAGGGLSSYDAIVSGVRAYNVNAGLIALQPRLLAYVKAGGNLIVQYNTNNRLGPLTADLGPYPFTIGSGRVTEEGAEVKVLTPEVPLLTHPNLIQEKDFFALGAGARHLLC